MAITDLICLSLSTFLLFRGFSRGFVRSILGPICLIIATALSLYFFNTHKNIILALSIGLFGPMALHWIALSYLKLWHQITNPDWKPSTPSRITGALLTLLWGWAFIIMTLGLLLFVPPFHQQITAMKTDIQRSYAFFIIKPLIDHATKPSVPSENTGAKDTPEAKANDMASLANDPRFQNVLNDPEIQEAINHNDYAKLMANPKIMALTQEMMQDPNMMQKLMSMQNQLIEQSK